MTFRISAALLVLLVGCGGSSASGSPSSSANSASGTTGGATGGAGGSGGGTGGASTGSTSTSATGTGGSGPTTGDVGVWTDAPGACPAGLPKVELHNAAELASASRGEDAYSGDAPATCYFLHDGDYQQTGVVMYVKVGGTSTARRVFVGESRTGVVIHGRASLDDGIGDLTISNMTIDLSGYVQSGSFNTLSLGTGKHIGVDHVTFTGDCATGYRGGHIETNGTEDLLVEECIIEKFGNCANDPIIGHEDHGVYLASGKNLTFRNNIIRGNSSRGIQMYTNSGIYGTLDTVLVERNYFAANGHLEYEDGLLVSSTGAGTIKNVTIQRNIFEDNYYSGVRFVGGAESAVVITKNTFVKNGVSATKDKPSEINLDDPGAGAGTTINANLFEVGVTLISDCFDGKGKGFAFGDNFVHGTIVTGTAGDCIGSQTLGDPMFTSATDLHPTNAAAAAYGAYGN